MVELDLKSLRIGLAICHCGTNIAGTVDIDYLKNFFRGMGLTVVEDHKHLCTEDGLKLIKEMIVDHKLDRLVIAACTPFLHGELFRRIAEEAGLNPSYVEIVNIREQCSWPHYGSKLLATLKARDLIAMGIAAAIHARPSKRVRIPITRKLLVIGGGVAGVTAALLAANAGIDVVLVEKSPFLGGNIARLDKLFPTLDCAPCLLGPLLAEVASNPRIKIYTLSEVEDVSGTVGRFRVRIRSRPRYVDESRCVAGCTKCIDVCPVIVGDEYTSFLGRRKAVWRPSPISVPYAPYIDPSLCIGCMSCVAVCDRNAIDFNQRERVIEEEVGAIIVAIGADLCDPSKLPLYGYGRCPNVVTSIELEWLLNSMGPTGGELTLIDRPERPRRICFIQCVGSRTEKLYEYCSAVCCLNTLKLALNIKLRYPDTEIVVFFTDMRTPSHLGEELYRRCLEMGIEFVRARVQRVTCGKDGKLLVVYEDTLNGEVRRELFDMAVLSIGFAPPPDLPKLARVLGIHVDRYGFAQPYHPKLYPSDTHVAGVFVAGTCSGPKDMTMSVMHAGLAVARALSILSKEFIEVELQVPELDEEKCLGCAICRDACSFRAISFERGRPSVDPLSCRGCGACVALCPAEALAMPRHSIERIRAMLRALFSLEKAESPLIPMFVCRWCGYAALDNAGVSKIRYPTNVRPILVPCSIAVPPRLILEAFAMGADGVLVVGCHEQDCHYRTGAARFKKIAEKIKEMLRSVGIDPRRFEFIETSAGEAKRLAEEISRFVDTIRGLGPIGSEAKSVV